MEPPVLPLVNELGVDPFAWPALQRLAGQSPAVVEHAGRRLRDALTQHHLAIARPDGEGGWRLELTDLGRRVGRDLVAHGRRSRERAMAEIERLSRASYPEPIRFDSGTECSETLDLCGTICYSRGVDESELAALTRQEVYDLVDAILEGVENVEESMGFSATWPSEMRDWCIVLLTRLHEGGTTT
jgi:hypothetical protein